MASVFELYQTYQKKGGTKNWTDFKSSYMDKWAEQANKPKAQAATKAKIEKHKGRVMKGLRKPKEAKTV